MKSQREKLETLLDSFPGVIETATLKALSLRVTHLEKLMSQLFQESSTKINSRVAKRQLIISLAALGITIILWVVFIVINLVS
jgi:lipopolysaccharide/colanic/teichoic acid biosynthesis glycosyltransferase